MATSISEPLPSGGVPSDRKEEPEATPPSAPGNRFARLLRGPADQPRWARPALLALLVATAFLYLWNLSNSGTANSFYAASVWAGTKSWKALFFASLDPSNSITVDKPPAALWVMALSGRIFGFSSFSMLLPQALEGIASVALLNAAVRRWSGPAAGLLAGAALAATPVAALMFRFNNPDAMLVLLLVVACYCTVRATEEAKLRWILYAGAAVGFAFLAKMLQGYIVIPALAVTYLVAAPTTIGRRLLHLLAGMGSIIVSTGWFLVVVALWPADARPFIGGSTNNSEWELALGYNGLGRIFGDTGGGAGGGGGGGNAAFGGATGITRMFSTTFGGEISWLLPSALIAMVAVLVLTLRAPRTDRRRAAMLLWGGWLLINGLVFSFMSGIIHDYYTIAIAPPIAALVGIGAVELWRERSRFLVRVALALMTGAAGVWAYFLLGRDSSWMPALRWVVLVVGVLSALGLLVGAHLAKSLATVLAASAVISGYAGSAAWAVSTAAQGHTGSIPTSGPSSSGGGMGGFGGGGGAPGGSSSGSGGKGGSDGDFGGFPGGGTSGTTRTKGERPTGTTGTAPSGTGGGATAGGGAGGGSSSALTALLKATDTRWAAAVVGDQTAADLELASRKAVMSMGGWSGTDNSPTLAQFKEYVAKGEIRYVIAGTGMGGGGAATTGTTGTAGTTGTGESGETAGGTGGFPGGGEMPSGGEMPGGGDFGGAGGGERPSGTGGGAPGGSSSSSLANLFGGSTSSSQISEITAWVKANYKTITVGGETVYDLSKPKS